MMTAMDFTPDKEREITVRGTEGEYQIVTGSNEYGGKMVIAIYSFTNRTEKTFGKVTDATKYLNKIGIGRKVVSQLRPELWRRFNAYKRRGTWGKFGPVGGGRDTEV